MGHQTETAAVGPSVLLLGTGHWGNPNRDLLNAQYDDMLSPRRQREIRECVERLKRFRPTKVALEVPPARADALNEQYRRYQAGALSLTAGEEHQLGFRLAAELGHEQVYAIDWQGTMGFGRALTFAREHNQSARLDEHIDRMRRETADFAARMAALSVLDLLRAANDPANLQRNHQWYMLLALVGEGDRYVGAEAVSHWYERNLTIFVNLTRITASPRDRILVVIGSGHVPLLTHFVQGSGLYALEPVAPYLG